MRRRHREGVGGANSWKVEPRNRGVGSHTQNRFGGPGLSVGRASVFFRFIAVVVLGPPGGSGQARGLRRGHLGA